MGSGSFFGGLFFGRLLGNKNDNPQERIGGIGQLFGLLLLIGIIAITVKFGIKGLIIASVISFIIIPVIYGIVRAKIKYSSKIYEEAMKLFENQQYALALSKAESVAQKNHDAAALAGILYLYGYGCDIDEKKAFSYFQFAQNKNMEAKGLWGFMMIEGIGCSRDERVGRKAMSLAAIQGKDAFSIMKIGEYQIHGTHGWDKDVKNGMKNLRIAADSGLSYAKYLVGKNQVEGIEGIPVNKERGYSLIQEAAKQGCNEAAEYLHGISI